MKEQSTLTFSERMKLEDDFYLWLYDKQRKTNVVMDDNPATFLAYLEIAGYEVKKKGAKQNDK